MTGPAARPTTSTTTRRSVDPCHSRPALGTPIREERPPARTMPAVRGMGRCCHDGPVRDVTLQRALDLAREHAVLTEPEEVPVGEAAGRRLAAAVTARADLPSEDASAMDGYAVRAADAPGLLAVAGESAAGAPLAAGLGRREAARISTGARLPDGADAVVRREDADERDGRVQVPAVRAGDHVRRRAEVVPSGAVVLPAGAWIRAHEVVA